MGSEVYKANSPPPAPASSSTPSSSSTTSLRMCKCSTLFHRIATLGATLGFYVILGSFGIMPSAATDLLQHSRSIFIPFVFKLSPKHVPQVMCTIEGVDIKMPVDTGSTGLLIGAPILPNIDSQIGRPAHHFFTSSKILYVGRLVKLPVRFGGEAGSYAQTRVPILIVDKSWGCPWYQPGNDTFDCPAGPNGEAAVERDTSNITYMGVGFGRNDPKDGMPIAAPQNNPFLNIDSIDGFPVSWKTMRAGYIVTTKGIHLGLTCHNTRGFAFEDLQPGLTHDTDARDWAMAQMCFSVNGEGRNCGTLLVDTGIAQMYIRPNEGVSIPSVIIRNPNKHGFAKMVRRVKRGTNITVAFPSFHERAASYTFIVGEGSAIEPEFVVPARAKSTSFINTGRNFLYGYSVAFDAVGGRFGFQPAHPGASCVL
ncbi:hypothetical protein BDU57DRAFT_518442 [Ampelomyces quisqualis]|uniref:Aspartic peptidase domain-containing protein n=1 Tax=Ampelomyces quisqualis TaxID=50730 RepID=A0A6A5QLV6_AMPQU|nr:hypothetical protein BDU57DRAFT_518442 [Ampelomyces quisqualis]